MEKLKSIKLTTDQKIVIACTGVTLVAAGAIMISNRRVNQKLKKCMTEICNVAAGLDNLEESIDDANYLMERCQQELIDTASTVNTALDTAISAANHEEGVKAQ